MSINDTGIDFMDFGEEKKETPAESKKQPTKVSPPKNEILKAVKSAVKPLKPKKESISSEDEKEALTLRMMISRYADSERFGSYLKELGFKLKTTDLAKLKKADLEALLERVKLATGNRSTKSMIDGLIVQGFLVGEKLAVKAGAKVDGLTNALFLNEQWLDDLESVRLQYLNFGMVDAKTRLALTTLQTGFVLHTQRTAMARPKTAPPAPKPVPKRMGRKVDLDVNSNVDSDAIMKDIQQHLNEQDDDKPQL